MTESPHKLFFRWNDICAATLETANAAEDAMNMLETLEKDLQSDGENAELYEAVKKLAYEALSVSSDADDLFEKAKDVFSRFFLDTPE